MKWFGTVKIDTEGAEQLVWEGMRETRERFCHVATVLELHVLRDPENAGQFLATVQRDGDFMVCEICGWRMRISDPSLPPEKYHARCGGAEARAPNERRHVRPSNSKRLHEPKRPATKRRSLQLGTLVARCLNRIGIKKKTGCGCGQREETLNKWGRRVLSMFRRR